MMHIPSEGELPDADWLEKARRLTVQLEAAATKLDRDVIIDKNAKVWGELKKWLLDRSHGKCWFSEAGDCFSDWHVEHFRPKKIAKNMDGTEREGYWWLAFDWKNLRICGGPGNVKKGTFFPLREGSLAASSTNRNTDDEVYYLLDPTILNDTLLLTFVEDGGTKPREDLRDWDYARATYSIERLKLDEFEGLREARCKIWQQCSRLIRQCGALMDENSKMPTATRRQKIDDLQQALAAMTGREQQLSAVAIECLRKSGFPWAQKLAAAARPRTASGFARELEFRGGAGI